MEFTPVAIARVELNRIEFALPPKQYNTETEPVSTTFVILSVWHRPFHPIYVSNHIIQPVHSRHWTNWDFSGNWNSLIRPKLHVLALQLGSASACPTICDTKSNHCGTSLLEMQRAMDMHSGAVHSMSNVKINLHQLSIFCVFVLHSVLGGRLRIL